MRQIISIVLLFLTAFSLSAQDSVVKQKLKINEIAIVGTVPIFPFYSYSSGRQVTYNFLNDDNVLNDLFKTGYTDTSKAIRMFRPIDFYGGNSMGGSVGVRALFNLQNNLKNKWETFIPLTILYEMRGFDSYGVAKQELKRIDTMNISGEMVYLDSISEKGSAFSFNSESLFIQSGLIIESGKRNFKFSTGLNFGLGIGVRNELKIVHQEYSIIQASNLDNTYYQETLDYTESTTQKVKPVVSIRLLVPFCIKLNFKKNNHLGLMAEMSPGFEMNQVINTKLMSRWMFFCSAGARYRF